jgi:hypothetical protein
MSLTFTVMCFLSFILCLSVSCHVVIVIHDTPFSSNDQQTVSHTQRRTMNDSCSLQKTKQIHLLCSKLRVSNQLQATIVHRSLPRKEPCITDHHIDQTRRPEKHHPEGIPKLIRIISWAPFVFFAEYFARMQSSK